VGARTIGVIGAAETVVLNILTTTSLKICVRKIRSTWGVKALVEANSRGSIVCPW